jgi:hypothetical protein
LSDPPPLVSVDGRGLPMDTHFSSACTACTCHTQVWRTAGWGLGCPKLHVKQPLQLPRRRSTADNRRGSHMHHGSGHPAARGGGGEGIPHASVRMAIEKRSPLPDPATKRRLIASAPHSGLSDRHVRGGRRPHCRYPCRPFRLCRQSTPTLVWRGDGFWVVATTRVWSPPVSPERAT